MLLEKLVDHGAFLAYKQPALRQTAVNNVKVIILPAAGKQDRVFVQDVSCGLALSAARKRLIYTVVIQLRPEQLFERFKSAEVFKELQNRLFPFSVVYLSTS